MKRKGEKNFIHPILPKRLDPRPAAASPEHKPSEMKRFIKEEEDMGKYSTSRYFIRRRLETREGGQKGKGGEEDGSQKGGELLGAVGGGDREGVRRRVRAVTVGIHRGLTRLGRNVDRTRREMEAEVENLMKSDKPRALSEPPRDPFKEVVRRNIVDLDREINGNRRMVNIKLKLCSANNYLKIINFNT
jgi:hypothetical protein